MSEVTNIVPEPNPIKSSPTVSNLLKALTQARKEFNPVKKTSENPFYKDSKGHNKKYADLTEMISATEPALTANGLHILQFPMIGPERTVGITTVIIHESGEFFEHTIQGCPADQKGKDGFRFDAQTIGIGFTYLARYGYRAILNLGTEDDDGNGLVNPPEQKKVFMTSLQMPSKDLPSAKPIINVSASEVVIKDSPESELDVLPTPEERTKIATQLKEFKQDSKQLREWVEKQTGKPWKESSKKSLETAIQKLKDSKNISELIKE